MVLDGHPIRKINHLEKSKYTPLLKRISGAAPKSDLLLRAIYFEGPQTQKWHNNGPSWGSGELWTSALGVKRVQRGDPPWSRGWLRANKADNGHTRKICSRSTFRANLLFRVSILRDGSVRESEVPLPSVHVRSCCPAAPRDQICPGTTSASRAHRGDQIAPTTWRET